MVTEQVQAITLTEAAVGHLKDIIAQQEITDVALRVFVSPGGCSGFQYGMALDNELQEGDLVFEQDGVRIVVDDFSMNYLRGSEIDYVESLMGAGFTVYNPNAVSSCGCGHSFDTADHEGNPQRCH